MLFICSKTLGLLDIFTTPHLSIALASIFTLQIYVLEISSKIIAIKISQMANRKYAKWYRMVDHVFYSKIAKSWLFCKFIFCIVIIYYTLKIKTKSDIFPFSRHCKFRDKYP